MSNICYRGSAVESLYGTVIYMIGYKASNYWDRNENKSTKSQWDHRVRSVKSMASGTMLVIVPANTGPLVFLLRRAGIGERMIS